VQSYTKKLIFRPFLANIQFGVIFPRILTFRNYLIISALRKSYKNDLKKNKKKDTTYQKNA